MNKPVEGQPTFSKETLIEIERTFLDPDYLILLANALKAERAARIEAETRLNQILMKKEPQTVTSTTYQPNAHMPKLSVNKTAEKLGVSTKTIYRMISDGRLKSARVGSLHRIDTDDISKMLAMENER